MGYGQQQYQLQQGVQGVSAYGTMQQGGYGAGQHRGLPSAPPSSLVPLPPPPITSSLVPLPPPPHSSLQPLPPPPPSPSTLPPLPLTPPASLPPLPLSPFLQQLAAQTLFQPLHALKTHQLIAVRPAVAGGYPHPHQQMTQWQQQRHLLQQQLQHQHHQLHPTQLHQQFQLLGARTLYQPR